MASRAEEKRLRREEREAKEAAARAAASRTRRMQLVGLVVLVIAIAGGAVIIASSSSTSKNSNSAGTGSAGGPQAPTDPAARIPLAENKNLASAAKAANCVVHSYPSEGRNHVTTKVNYKTNPPTSGNHNPTPALDGVYDPGNTPAKENYVHTLEHGRVELQYRPGTSTVNREKLETLLAEPFNGKPGGYKMVLFENNTKMPYAVAATAWTHLIGCKTISNKTWDALRDFRNAYIDKAPESSVIPPNDL